MKILLIDTCGVQGSVAIADTQQPAPILATAYMPGRTASERLISTIRGILEERAWKPADLEAIAVVAGPGSFTGVRVGLSAARGLSEAIGLAITPVSRLEMLAQAVQSPTLEVCALLDAGRGEFYCGRYQMESLREESIVTLDKALAIVSTAAITVVCETGVHQRLADAGHASINVVEEPTAADALTLALQRIRQQPRDGMDFDANYLRATDAEIFAKQASSNAQ